MKVVLQLVLAGLLWVHTSAYTGGTAHSAVVQLDESSFDEALKDLANPLWFLKFYAPWCGHCKSLAPVLDSVAPKLAGKMAIGKIDCTIHKSLCNKFDVRGYPTLKFSIDGDVQDYPGSRDEKSLIAFAQKMSSPSVTFVSSYDEALRFAKENTEEGVAFLGFDPKSEKGQPTELEQMFHQVARKKQAQAYFLWWQTDIIEREYAFVHRIEEGIQPRGWGQGTEQNENTPESMLQFVQEQNVPTLTTFGANNFYRIGKNGRNLVLAVVDFSNEELVAETKDHMHSYIAKKEEQITDQYYFGVIDGTKWGRFLQQFNVHAAENPQFIVLNVPEKVYWQNSTYSNLFDFMKAKDEGIIQPEVASRGGRRGVFAKLERVFLSNLPYSVFVLLALVVGIVFLLVPKSDDLRPPYDKEQVEPENDGGDQADQTTPKDDEPKKEK